MHKTNKCFTVEPVVYTNCFCLSLWISNVWCQYSNLGTATGTVAFCLSSSPLLMYSLLFQPILLLSCSDLKVVLNQCEWRVRIIWRLVVPEEAKAGRRSQWALCEWNYWQEVAMNNSPGTAHIKTAWSLITRRTKRCKFDLWACVVPSVRGLVLFFFVTIWA